MTLQASSVNGTKSKKKTHHSSTQRQKSAPWATFTSNQTKIHGLLAWTMHHMIQQSKNGATVFGTMIPGFHTEQTVQQITTFVKCSVMNHSWCRHHGKSSLSVTTETLLWFIAASTCGSQELRMHQSYQELLTQMRTKLECLRICLSSIQEMLARLTLKVMQAEAMMEKKFSSLSHKVELVKLTESGDLEFFSWQYELIKNNMNKILNFDKLFNSQPFIQ